MNNPEKGIGVTMSEKDKEKFEENREILTCIIKCFEVYGWLRIGLKDRREDSSISSFNNSNFKELPEFRANSRDNTFRKHLDAVKRNAMYTTKTTQNGFFGKYQGVYIKKNLRRGRQPAVRTTVWNLNRRNYRFYKHWAVGNHSAICIWGKTKRKLFKYIGCDRTTGEELCNSIFKVFEKSPSNIKNCRFQTIDGEAKMPGWNKEYAVLLQEIAPPAVYNYCFDHDLSLVLSKCSKVRETHVRFTETTWNIFQIFTKRCQRISRCFVKHYGCWEKHCTLTFRTCMSHTYNVLKALNQQIVATAAVLFRYRDF